MITIFLTMLLICSNVITSDQPYFVITPERQNFLKKLDRELDPLITCFELKTKEQNKDECARIINIFSDPIRCYHAQINWRKWESQNRFCTLDSDNSIAKQEAAENDYHDHLRQSFGHLKLMYPSIRNACSDKSAGKTAQWHTFEKFKNATKQRAKHLLKNEWLLNPLKEDLEIFKQALERAMQSPKGKDLIAKQTEKQRYTLEEIKNGNRDAWEAINHDHSIGRLLTELAMLDPESKQFYEEYVLDSPKYNFEPIHNIVTPLFTKHNIGQIRKLNGSWIIVPLSNDRSNNLATLRMDRLVLVLNPKF